MQPNLPNTERMIELIHSNTPTYTYLHSLIGHLDDAPDWARSSGAEMLVEEYLLPRLDWNAHILECQKLGGVPDKALWRWANEPFQEALDKDWNLDFRAIAEWLISER